MIILNPIVCLLGIVTSLITIYVVSHKTNRKELKENQYDYMRLNAIINVFIFLIQILSLISECQNFLGVFCSSIRSWSFSQYFKIIFVEYVSNVLRFASNFTYVGFAFNRLSLIGKDHNKLVKYMSELKIKQFIFTIIFPCLILPVVKLFRFIPNKGEPENDFPNPIAFMFCRLNVSVIILFIVFNFLSDFLSYFVFLVINFVLDICITVKLKRTIDEKEENKKRLGIITKM